MVISRRKSIKSKIKYYIKSKTDDINVLETYAKIEKEKITYKENNALVTVIIYKNNINVIRESDEFKQVLKFKVNKKTISEYYIKDINISLEFNIITKKLKIDKKSIHIEYIICENNEEFEYDIKVINTIKEEK